MLPFSCCFPEAIADTSTWERVLCPGVLQGARGTLIPKPWCSLVLGPPGASSQGHETRGAGKVMPHGSPPQPEPWRRSSGPWVPLAWTLGFPGHIPRSACSPGAGRSGWLPSRGHWCWTRHKFGLAGAVPLAAPGSVQCTCWARKSRFTQPSDDTIPGVSLGKAVQWLGRAIPSQTATRFYCQNSLKATAGSTPNEPLGRDVMPPPPGPWQSCTKYQQDGSGTAGDDSWLLHEPSALPQIQESMLRVSRSFLSLTLSGSWKREISQCQGQARTLLSGGHWKRWPCSHWDRARENPELEA